LHVRRIWQRKSVNQTPQIVAHFIEALGLKLIHHDKPPFLGISVKAGDRKGEVLGNKQGIEECRRLVGKLIDSISNSASFILLTGLERKGIQGVRNIFSMCAITHRLIKLRLPNTLSSSA